MGMNENEAISELRESIELPFGSAISDEALELAIKAIEEIQQYRAIGTPDECRAAVEKQRAKKPLEASEQQKKSGYKHACCKCGCTVGYTESKGFVKRTLIEHAARYCCICGQRIQWEDENETD